VRQLLPDHTAGGGVTVEASGRARPIRPTRHATQKAAYGRPASMRYRRAASRTVSRPSARSRAF
jgi:hypothetical protein